MFKTDNVLLRVKCNFANFIIRQIIIWAMVSVSSKSRYLRRSPFGCYIRFLTLYKKDRRNSYENNKDTRQRFFANVNDRFVVSIPPPSITRNILRSIGNYNIIRIASNTRRQRFSVKRACTRYSENADFRIPIIQHNTIIQHVVFRFRASILAAQNEKKIQVLFV